MKHLQKISLIIPCHNEEKGIGKVIAGIPQEELKSRGYLLEVIVINNNSTDKTVKVAQKHGATVIHETKKGKGYAIKAGFNAVSPDTKYIVMLDGDNTYKASEIIRLVEPLTSNFADVIVGSRLSGKMLKNSLKAQNRIANWGYTFLVRAFYQTNVTDVLSGYFAWKKEVIDDLSQHLDSAGFEIEMEMITKMVKLGYDVYSVPITYDERRGTTKIESLKDGIKILSMFAKNLNWSPSQQSTSAAQGMLTRANYYEL